MLRTAVLVALVNVAAANHLSGPMQDRLTACQAQYCSTFATTLAAANYSGLDAGSFNDLIQPPLNGIAWTHDLAFALRFMGYINEDFMYKAVAGGPANLTGRATANLTDVFLACFEPCKDLIEPIFQPVGRSFFEVVFGGTVVLPCQTEFDACMAANPDPAGVSTGSVAGLDLKFTVVHPSASASICQPEKTLLAYKKSYNLTADCTAANPMLPEGGATALALTKCLQKSRAEGGQSLANPTDPAAYTTCLDIGGPDCGVPYTCGAESSATTTTAADSVSASAPSGFRAKGGFVGLMTMAALGLCAF